MKISRLSSNKKILNESSKMYIEVLKKSGFEEEFIYQEIKKTKPNITDIYYDKDKNNKNEPNNNINSNKYKNKGSSDNCNNKEKCHENRKRKI